MASDYVNRLGGARSSLAVKAACRVATTANITLTGEQTIDGVAVGAGDRVLVKAQTRADENGIYVVNATGWERAKDWNGTDDITTGTRVLVYSGTSGAGEYYVTTTGTITVGTTSIAFALVSEIYDTASLQQPMEGQCVALDMTTAVSRWVGGLVYNEDEDEFHVIESIGSGHEQEHSMLVVRKSQDGLDTLNNLKTVFSRASDPKIRATSFGRMGNGRVGGIVITGGTSRKAWSVLTDDWFSTATVAEVTSSLTLGSHFVYGLVLPWPAAAGGHDTDGFQILSYAGTTDVKVLRTGDRGATWSDAVLKTSTGLPGTAQEPSMVQLPDGRWLILVRTTANGNIWATVGNEAMTTWSDWTDTGVALGSNPVHALIDGTRLYVNVFYREDFPGSVEDNCLVSWVANANDVGDDPTILSAGTRTILSALPSRAIGYPFSERRGAGGSWYHVFKAGEDSSTQSGAGSMLCAIRQLPGTTRGIASMASAVQHLENPTFTAWPRGTSFSSTSTAQVVAGRWYLNPSGATCTVDRVEVPDAVRYTLPFRSQYGLQMSNVGSAGNNVGIFQRWLGPDAPEKAINLTNRQRIWVRLYGWGTFPSGLRAPIVVNGTDAVRNTVSSALAVPQGIEGDAPWVTEVELRTDSLETLGISESAITSAYLAIDNGNASSEFTMKLAGAFLFTGIMPPMEPPIPSAAATAAAVDRYCQRIATTASDVIASGVARSSTIAWGALHYSPKVTSPTLSVSTATDVHTRAGGDVVATDVSFATATETTARIIVTVAAGLTTGQAQQIEIVASPSATPYIEINCGG